MKVKAWLQTCRAQSAPETVLGVLVPYLVGAVLWDWKVLLIGVFLVFTHWASFGHNGVMDWSYDMSDPTKEHHPLMKGELSLTKAHNVVHWGMSTLMVFGVILTLWLSPNPLYALIAFLVWYVFGHAYNDGLSKESPFGFMAISICTAAMCAWGWFLSHESLSAIGWIYIAYMFMGMVFQISWSGFVVDMPLSERSNILDKMGAVLEPHPDLAILNGRPQTFYPYKAGYYGYLIKVANIGLAWILLMQMYTQVKLLWALFFTVWIGIYLSELTRKRAYHVKKELFNASIMEILTIYFPIAILLPYIEAMVLMVFGILWFFGWNRWLWGTAYPDV